MKSLRYILTLVAIGLGTLAAEAQPNLFLGATVEASTTNPRTEVQMAVDGKFTPPHHLGVGTHLAPTTHSGSYPASLLRHRLHCGLYGYS